MARLPADPPAAPRPDAAAAATRRVREAAALRENLRKRKDQARVRAARSAGEVKPHGEERDR